MNGTCRTFAALALLLPLAAAHAGTPRVAGFPGFPGSPRGPQRPALPQPPASPPGPSPKMDLSDSGGGQKRLCLGQSGVCLSGKFDPTGGDRRFKASGDLVVESAAKDPKGRPQFHWDLGNVHLDVDLSGPRPSISGSADISVPQIALLADYVQPRGKATATVAIGFGGTFPVTIGKGSAAQPLDTDPNKFYLYADLQGTASLLLTQSNKEVSFGGGTRLLLEPTTPILYMDNQLAQLILENVFKLYGWQRPVLGFSMGPCIPLLMTTPLPATGGSGPALQSHDATERLRTCGNIVVRGAGSYGKKGVNLQVIGDTIVDLDASKNGRLMFEPGEARDFAFAGELVANVALGPMKVLNLAKMAMYFEAGVSADGRIRLAGTTGTGNVFAGTPLAAWQSGSAGVSLLADIGGPEDFVQADIDSVSVAGWKLAQVRTVATLAPFAAWTQGTLDLAPGGQGGQIQVNGTIADGWAQLTGKGDVTIAGLRLAQAAADLLQPLAPPQRGDSRSPHLYLDASAGVLRYSGQLRVAVDPSSASFQVDSELADLGRFRMAAQTEGNDVLHAGDFTVTLAVAGDAQQALQRRLGAALQSTAVQRQAAASSEKQANEKALGDTQRDYDQLDGSVGAEFRRDQDEVNRAQKKLDDAQADLDNAKSDCKKKAGPFGFVCDAVDAAKKSVDAASSALDGARRALDDLQKSARWANYQAKAASLATLRATHDGFGAVLAGCDDVANALSRGAIPTIQRFSFSGSLRKASGALAVTVGFGDSSFDQSWQVDLRQAAGLDLAALTGKIVDAAQAKHKSQATGGPAQPAALQQFVQNGSLGLRQGGPFGIVALAGQPLVNANGKCLDVDAGDWQARRNGGKVQSWNCNGGGQQRWRLDGDRLISSNGKCLDVSLDDWKARRNGGKVQAWDCNGGDQQKWRLDKGRFVSANGKCLDLSGDDFASKRDGGKIQVWDCNGAGPQSWRPQQ